jgi:DNA ligase-1
VELADLVSTSAALSATRAKSAKVRALADLLRRAPHDEVAVVVGFLVGAPRQGRVGVGWSTLGRGGDVSPAAEATLTVGDVEAELDRLQRTTGPGSAAARQALISGLFARATEEEAAFLRRLLLGELRQGALEGVMADAIAAAAGIAPAAVRRAAMLAGDLCHVAAVAMEQGEGGLAQIGLQVLRPVLPMLAATAATVAEALSANGRSSVEWKLDGARIQAHRRGETVRLFTRSLNDVSDRLPGIADVVRRFPATAVILDGEVFGAGIDEEGAGLFQDAMSRFSSHDPAPGSDLSVRFFDVLHLDGGDLIDRPLEERLSVLERISGPYRVPGILTSDPSEAQAFSEDALARGHEGVMVKSATSQYEAGRRGSAWRKVSRCAPSTWWCWPPSGVTAGAGVGCRTSTSARSTPRPVGS